MHHTSMKFKQIWKDKIRCCNHKFPLSVRSTALFDLIVRLVLKRNHGKLGNFTTFWCYHMHAEHKQSKNRLYSN